MAFDPETFGRSRVPVLDPVRVMLIDPDLHRRAGLARAIDLDPDLAVVATTADLRPGAIDLAWSTPDLVVIGLPPDDERCRAIVARVTGEGRAPAVLIVGGAPGATPAAASGGYYRELAERIRNAGLARKRGRDGNTPNFAPRGPAFAGLN